MRVSKPIDERSRELDEEEDTDSVVAMKLPLRGPSP